MEVRREVELAPLTTLRLGGRAERLVEAGTAAELADAVRNADAAGEPVLLLGGGSNLVLADEGWPGTAVLIRSRGTTLRADGDARVLTVQAGEPWDELVALTVAEGWAGLECLAGIPGLAGATPVQNVGAYGQEVAGSVVAVAVLDRQRRAVRDLTAAECGFGYRDSVFKHAAFEPAAGKDAAGKDAAGKDAAGKQAERYVVLSVTFGLRARDKSAPVRYAELARALGVQVGEVAPLTEVGEAVLALRRGKGMVLDAADLDTWSVGSFFTNPVLAPAAVAAFEARLEPGAAYPSWPADDPPGGRKLSAAWLIERSGFAKGYGGDAVRVSGKHTLALTHRGGGSTAELVALAREIRDGVRDRFGVSLRPEPRLVGVTL